MRIEDFRSESGGGRVTIRARVVWEDWDRPPIELRFGTAAGDRPESAGAEPFLVACAHSARLRGERRIRIEGAICPLLHDGVRTVQRILSSWYGGSPGAAIEPAKGFRSHSTRAARAGLFLSGGVDSLHALFTNRRIFSPDHPASYRTALHVPGFSFPDPSPDDRARSIASRQKRAVAAVAARTGLEVAAVETNAGTVETDFEVHVRQSHGAELASAAHVLSARLGTAAIASSFEAPKALEPYGSHPVLDSLYSSSALAVSHEGLGYTRLEKVGDLAAWEPAQDSLMVCFEGPLSDERLNCGRCEKCLRTMTALSIAGGLPRFPVFGTARLDAEAIDEMPIGYHPHAFAHYWEPMAEALRGQGRADLARAVSRRVEEARRLHRWLTERDWKGKVRRLDRRLFGGRLAGLAREWRERIARP